MTTSTEADSISQLATLAHDIRRGEDDSAEFLVVPPDHTIFSLETLQARPHRARGNVTVNDATSFTTVFESMKQAASRIYGQLTPSPRFLAVLNDHTGESDFIQAGWRDHTITYACPLSVEWKTWTAGHKKMMSQADFAQFIEDNLPDIVQPEPADMLEVSRTLEAKKNVQFKSGIRLDNGDQQFQFEETTEAKAGQKGQLSIPERFTIAIPVFEGAKARNAIVARLRYRIDNGKLVMWFDLERHHKDLEAAAKEVWTEIEQAAGCQIINGSPS